MSGLEIDQARVLIVDDNRPMRVLVRSLLRAFGLHATSEASDPSEAFEVMRGSVVDLVITDLAMKPIDGIEFCSMVRLAPDSPNPFVPLIMMTGHAERSRVQSARDAGVTSFLVKPLSAKALAFHLHNAINHPRPFVRSKSYFGPDRRQSLDPHYSGPKRRASDREAVHLDLD